MNWNKIRTFIMGHPFLCLYLLFLGAMMSIHPIRDDQFFADIKIQTIYDLGSLVVENHELGAKTNFGIFSVGFYAYPVGLFQGRYSGRVDIDGKVDMRYLFDEKFSRNFCCGSLYMVSAQ